MTAYTRRDFARMAAAGTCRMGNDPKPVVTNRHGPTHEIGYYFVADGGLQVTNDGFNPVLNIMAPACPG